MSVFAEHSSVQAESIPPYHTLQERHLQIIGEDGKPTKHTILRVVRALEPLNAIPYIIDTDRATVEVTSGGHAESLRQAGAGFWVASIVLNEQLQPGEKVHLAYTTDFDYDEPPPPVFRRGIGPLAMEKLGVSIRFHPSKLPEHIFWAAWNGYQEDALIIPGSEELAQLRPASDPLAGMEIHRTFTNLQSTVVGAHWQWEALSE